MNNAFLNQKSTKIVATIGPSSDSEEKIRQLYEAGMNVVRLNFSHGDHGYFERIVEKTRNVSKEIAIILDTKGPEIRTGKVENGEIKLKEGDEIIFTTDDSFIGNSKKITISYDNLLSVNIGNKILIDDGLIETEIIRKLKDGLIAKVLNEGLLGSKKTVTIWGHDVDIPFISDKDREDILFSINKNSITFIAASFVRTEKDVLQIRKILDEHGSNAKIISKIEHRLAVENIDKIIAVSDGIMVARGDLGVEIPLEDVPEIQSTIIRKCNILGKPVIVATQMLESMKNNPRPTRAEVNDVATAIRQGADAVMLSGETANGKYPVKAVETMTKIAIATDKLVKRSFKTIHMEDIDPKERISSFVSRGACEASKILGTRIIFTPTISGYSARMVSRFKPKCKIIAPSTSRFTCRELQLSWGVIPYHIEDREAPDDIVDDIVKDMLKNGSIKNDDKVVITGGFKKGVKGSTNILEVYTAEQYLE